MASGIVPSQTSLLKVDVGCAEEYGLNDVDAGEKAPPYEEAGKAEDGVTGVSEPWPSRGVEVAEPAARWVAEDTEADEDEG